METVFSDQDRLILSRLALGLFDSKESFELKRQAEILSCQKGFKRLQCARGLGLSLYHHQRAAVLRVLREMRGRAILADEVGLGKTIEAGVILKEYWLRGLVRRALILVPAAVVAQWHGELVNKIRLQPAVARAGRDWEEALVIASLDTAKRPANAELIAGLPWDIVIVDEAHRLKNNQSLNWQFINGLSAKYLLLLTATPVQNDLKELYNMVTLVRPGQFGTYRSFKKRFVVDKHNPRNLSALKELLSELTIRTRRAEAVTLPSRDVEMLEVAQTEPEKQVYRELTLLAQEAYTKSAGRKLNVLPLIVILREACSSAAALAGTLRAAASSDAGVWAGARGEDWLRLAQKAISAGVPAKAKLLVKLLSDSHEKVIVFTEFRATQRYLGSLLDQAGVESVALRGGLGPRDQQEVLARFRDRIRVLVATDVGGEGLNLEFCSNVINYDLPWNPMKVEQRIGRVHRIGQKRPVRIFNMAVRDTVESYVLQVLDRKINMFRTVIGELDLILASLPKSFERRVAEIALLSPTGDAIVRGFDELGAEVEDAVREYRRRVLASNSVLDAGDAGSE